MTSSITMNQVFNSIQVMVNDSGTLKPKSIGISIDFRKGKMMGITMKMWMKRQTEKR